jgi:hypothetical protein
MLIILGVQIMPSSASIYLFIFLFSLSHVRYFWEGGGTFMHLVILGVVCIVSLQKHSCPSFCMHINRAFVNRLHTAVLSARWDGCSVLMCIGGEKLEVFIQFKN